MSRINRLDEHLNNMITAGEVVECSQGIVKELIENCIDAHASNIEVQISQGDIATITTIDDGDSMDPEDVTLASEWHATSKLKEVNGLWNTHTMGFRGETLPSIASVSHVLLRTNDDTTSTEVEISYGRLISAGPCGTPKGAMIEIQNLFQKTPARFRHLKNSQYEFSLISNVVQRFTLSHPEIGFCLSHDGGAVFKTKDSGSLLEILMQTYGRNSTRSTISLGGSDQDYKIKGYIMQPQFNHATKYYTLLYINDHMIRSYHLRKAVLDAYSPYIPRDKYPIVVIDLLMDAQLVDVNVHPSKWEIHLSKEGQLGKPLYETTRKALQEQLEVSRVNITRETVKEEVEKQGLQFTYEHNDSISRLHEEVNGSFIHPEKNEKPSLDMEKLHRKIGADRNRREESAAPIQPKTKEILPEIREETTSYESKNSTSVKVETEEADVKVQHEDTDRAGVLSAADVGSEARTEAIETDIFSDTAVAYKEISQSEGPVYEKKAEAEQPRPLNPSLP